VGVVVWVGWSGFGCWGVDHLLLPADYLSAQCSVSSAQSRHCSCVAQLYCPFPTLFLSVVNVHASANNTSLN
jgi:hypothetical protein